MAHKILVADDNEQIRRLLTISLEQAGYSVAAAASGIQALELLKTSSQFDLILTDLVMTDMDGLALLTEIKRTDPGLPVIAMSGAFSGRLLKFAASFGVPTIEKPFDLAKLLKVVESALSQNTVG